MAQPVSSLQYIQLQPLPQYAEGTRAPDSQSTQSTLSSQSEDLGGCASLFQSISNVFHRIWENLLSCFGYSRSPEIADSIPLLPSDASYIDQKINAVLREMRYDAHFVDTQATAYLHASALDLHELHKTLMRYEALPIASRHFF